MEESLAEGKGSFVWMLAKVYYYLEGQRGSQRGNQRGEQRGDQRGDHPEDIRRTAGETEEAKRNEDEEENYRCGYADGGCI